MVVIRVRPANITDMTTTKGVPMTTTHDYYCYCGCGAIVQVSFPDGFAGTTALVTPCPNAPKFVASFEIRKSAVLEMQPVETYTSLTHKEGLVLFV